MTPEEQLDEARAKEAWRIYMFHHNKRPRGEDEYRVPAEIAARLAREAAETRIAELEARVAELEAALRPSMWVGPTGIDISFSAPGRPISLPGTAGGPGGYSRSTSTPVDDSGRADTEVKEPRND